ncbi:putative integral to membrane protein [Naematelia encephala]|uniref:Glycerophosphocholine acyltransferase 1 n=1 Tax=Naematelia encephala TaxID=71784 RepID=A0A1Y2B0R0_9TREE|nr:putative integral to membrane protein [Naematelia encephala]
MPESPYLEPSTSPGSRPSLTRSNSSFTSLVSKTMGERYGDEWGGGATILLDVVETFFDSRLDLFNRRLKAQSARLKSRAVELLPKGLRTPAGGGILLVEDEEDDNASGEEGGARERRGTGERYRREVEREVERIKVKLAAKVTNLSSQWRSAQIVRTKEKVSFLFGVMSLTFTCLLYGLAPEWMPFAYTAQSAFYLPLRIYTYKKKAWHYFLFGLCYFANVLDLLWIWVFPSSTILFIASYLLTLGPIASAIITWRNSLVFHSLDKVTSLFIHMYPPLVLTIIRHVYPNAEERYTGLKHVGDYSWWSMILIAGIPYVLWQAAYYKFISIDRKPKIESGQRQSSFHYMLNDKRGPIGKALRGIRPEHRELWFIFGQLIYSIIVMLPPALLLIHSPLASSIFLIVIFAVSAWNGASFYVEVFGRKFERELERLRKEMELASATGTNTASSQPSPSNPSTPFMNQSFDTDTGDALANSPLVLPGTKQSAADMEVPELELDKAAHEVERDTKKSQ